MGGRHPTTESFPKNGKGGRPPGGLPPGPTPKSSKEPFPRVGHQLSPPPNPTMESFPKGGKGGRPPGHPTNTPGGRLPGGLPPLSPLKSSKEPFPWAGHPIGPPPDPSMVGRPPVHPTIESFTKGEKVGRPPGPPPNPPRKPSPKGGCPPGGLPPVYPPVPPKEPLPRAGHPTGDGPPGPPPISPKEPSPKGGGPPCLEGPHAEIGKPGMMSISPPMGGGEYAPACSLRSVDSSSKIYEQYGTIADLRSAPQQVEIAKGR